MTTIMTTREQYDSSILPKLDISFIPAMESADPQTWDGIANWGRDNRGIGNIGNGNTGNENIGNRNIGNDNIGNGNRGNDNIGNGNRGNGNRGNDNRGNDNRGDGNRGNDRHHRAGQSAEGTPIIHPSQPSYYWPDDSDS